MVDRVVEDLVCLESVRPAAVFFARVGPLQVVVGLLGVDRQQPLPVGEAHVHLPQVRTVPLG